MAKSVNQSIEPLNLLDILDCVGADFDRRILECLDFEDVQDMACACKTLAAVPRRHSDVMEKILDAYRDSYLIRLWPCQSRELRRKILKAIRRREYRIVYFDVDEFLLSHWNGKSLYDALSQSWGNEIPFGRLASWSSFSSAHHSDLEEIGLDRGLAYDDTQVWDNEVEETAEGGLEESDDEPSSNKRQRREDLLQCDAKDCRNPNVSRVYFVRPKFSRVSGAGTESYCGTCMDKSNALRLRWCSEHLGHFVNNEWELQEYPSYRHGWEHTKLNSPASWGLQEGEFMARLFTSSAPFNISEIRFIGRGPLGKTE